MTDPSNAHDRRPESRWIEWERAREVDPHAPPALPTLPAPSDFAEHRRCFDVVDAIASPLRAALADCQPPRLPDYGELTQIGRGGMGIVYRAQHTKTRRVDAIKIIRPDRLSLTSPQTVQQMLARFENESRLAARVSHASIVPVYHVGDHDGRPWYSMQYIDGPTLHEVTRVQRLSTDAAVRYLEQAARAVHAVHQRGILHGDIKPQNILIDQAADRPMIADFGLAELERRTIETDSGLAGTLSYMAPEMLRSAVSPESDNGLQPRGSIEADIYSLGATLWYALRGASPWGECNSAEEYLARLARRDVAWWNEGDCNMPAPVLQVCRRCLAEDPVERYRSAAELADDLAAWLARPQWNRHFPGLGRLLWTVVAPLVAICGVIVNLLIQVKMPLVLIGGCMFAGYLPLFASFIVSRPPRNTEGQAAQRGIWSVWLGHCLASLVGLISMLVILGPDGNLATSAFFPLWSALSALTFFAKSASFWIGYRWIGVLWLASTLAMAWAPAFAPLIFGGAGAITCVAIPFLDRAFADH